MGWDRIQSNWEDYKPRVRERWARLAPSEIDAVGGDRQRLIGGIQRAYNVDQRDAEEQVKSFEQTADPNVGWDGPGGPGRRTDD
jgi:uncharacterized protein YjbJ (UPF0337 family)